MRDKAKAVVTVSLRCRTDVVRRAAISLSLAAAVCCAPVAQAQSQSHTQTAGAHYEFNSMLADLGSLKTRNIHFGRGTRTMEESISESRSPVLTLPALSAYSIKLSDLSERRIDNVFKRRIRAELDFYGLVGNNGHDEEFRYDAEDWSASVVLRIPVTYLNLYGKFGAIHQNSGYRGLINSNALDSVDARGLPRWSSIDGFASIGAELKLGFFNLFGEYMRIDSEIESEVDTFSTGIKFRF